MFGDHLPLYVQLGVPHNKLSQFNISLFRSIDIKPRQSPGPRTHVYQVSKPQVSKPQAINRPIVKMAQRTLQKLITVIKEYDLSPTEFNAFDSCLNMDLMAQEQTFRTLIHSMSSEELLMTLKSVESFSSDFNKTLRLYLDHVSLCLKICLTPNKSQMGKHLIDELLSSEGTPKYQAEDSQKLRALLMNMSAKEQASIRTYIENNTLAPTESSQTVLEWLEQSIL